MLKRMLKRISYVYWTGCYHIARFILPRTLGLGSLYDVVYQVLRCSNDRCSDFFSEEG